MSASAGSVADTATSGLTDSTAGRNNTGRGRGGRRGARFGGRSGTTNQRGSRASIFKGSTPEMTGNVFECYEEQSDRRQYAYTLEALEGYVKKTCKFPQDIAPLFAVEMKQPVVAKPASLSTTADETDRAIWHERLKAYMKRENELEGNFATIYAVAWGQCSEAMRARLKAHAKYNESTAKNDCYWLLKQIKSITMKFDETKYGFISIMDARANFLNCRQGQQQSASDFIAQLRSWSDAIEYHGGSVAESHELIGAEAADGTIRSLEERKRMAIDRTLAAAAIRGADPTRYGTLIAELSNQFATGKDNYPNDITGAYSMLVTYRSPSNHRPRGTQTHQTGATAPPADASAMTFAQQGSVGGIDGVVYDGITCYNCQGMGHYSSQCPQGTTPRSKSTGTTLTQYGVMMAQSNTGGIDPNWILLDSQSTISVFNNCEMLSNIRSSPHVLRAFTNGGFQDSNMIGEFRNLGDVWYNRASIANILALSDVRKVCRVTTDTSSEAAMVVHRSDGTMMKFVEHPSGLYVFKGSPTNSTSKIGCAYTLLSTVAEHKQMFSRRQIEAADAARSLYRKIGRPDEAEFVNILKRNLIRNCPVTPDDAKRALIIYGPDIAVLKGKMTQSAAAPRAPTFEAVALPPPFLDHHRNVTLCVDLFFVQGLAYLHTISRGIGFRTVAPVKDRTAATLLRELKAAIHLYVVRGFVVCDVHSDSEFECLRESLRPIEMNIVTPDSHVGEVERSIRTIKERLRSCVHGLPFKRLPKLLLHHMVGDAVRCLNSFPWRLGISSTLSPAAIITGLPTPDYACMRLELGAYVQVFEACDPTNTPRARSLGAIALMPTGNAQGDYFFLSMSTGARISRHAWTEVPITDAAIARVEALALADGQPLIQERGLVVEWRHNQHIDDDAYDADFFPQAVPDEAYDLADYDPVTPDELTDLLADVDPLVAPAVAVAPLDPGADEAINDDEPDVDVEDDDTNDNDYDCDVVYGDADHTVYYDDAVANADDNAVDNDNAAVAYAHIQDQGAQNEGAQGARAQNQGAQNEGARNAINPRTYNLRDRQQRRGVFKDAMDNPHDGKSYFPPARQFVQTDRHLIFAHVMAQMSNETCMIANDRQLVLAHVMTQMSAKAGIKKHGKAAENAMLAEFSQLETLSVYQPVHAHSLTPEQRKSALRAINLIKEKRCGKLKGRTVADGRSQKNLYNKADIASPTVATDALMLTILVEAHEARDVGIADVAGAYLKADMVDFVIMKFTGASVDLLCLLNSEHEAFVVMEGKAKVLYVRLDKAMYGCVKSAFLWYDLLSTSLQKMGFVINPYDPCVANCIIEGSQCTISWYVDDTKISHVNPNVVTMIIEKMEQQFGKMTVTRGDEHIFLGMHIKYDKRAKTATITMKEYLKEAIDESGMDIQRVAATPARKTLFDVDETATPLSAEEAMKFHSVVAKLLYVSIRARMDLLLAVSFLSTRVSKSTVQDRAKLKRILEYIHGTMEQSYTLGADTLGKLRTWVNASYAVHPDMKSHTGGIISFGIGGLIGKSLKQKLNTKSSTEAELVGASDYLTHTLWVRLFMEAQGYAITENYFEQDNESAIKLEKNGRLSAGPKSRHIDIRHFWIKDRVRDAGITVRHCPTLQMIGDFFTKPLEGALF